MARWFWLSVLAVGMVGCSGLNQHAPGWPRATALAGSYDFNWRLSGEPALAPLQVFSGLGRIWLQFPPGRTPPAFFAKTATGMQPLPYQSLEPYLVIEGEWDVVVLRGAHQVAQIERYIPAGD